MRISSLVPTPTRQLFDKILGDPNISTVMAKANRAEVQGAARANLASAVSHRNIRSANIAPIERDYSLNMPHGSLDVKI